jgi:hypothetical protein
MNNYNNELVSWLRDFAAANHDGFEPEQIQRLNDAANTIENLIAELEEQQSQELARIDMLAVLDRITAERDDARMLYCEFVAQDHREGYVDHPEQTPQDVAQSMGWEGISFPDWENVRTTQYWCDNCGNPVSADDAFHYSELPCDVASANKGESATICRECERKLEADCNNDDFRTTDMS